MVHGSLETRPVYAVKPRVAKLSAEDAELLRSVADARQEWLETRNGFDLATDELLIDYYTYRLKACEARYGFFLKLLKKREHARFQHR